MLLEWLLVATALAVGVRTLGLRERYATLLLTSMTLSGAAFAVATTSLQKPPPPRPIEGGGEGFATSNGCRGCHPSEYSSWHDSFHRRMTQSASRGTVAATELRQGGRLRLETGGRTVELYSRRDQLWARLPDPGVTSAAPGTGYETSFRVAPIRDVQIQLLSGSHHHQVFWVAGARQGELRALPVVYSIDEQRLLPRRDAFLNPPDAPEQAVRWNSNCVQCHVVAGQPAHDAATDTFSTSAAELGIACEACHGPSAEHARAMRDPLTRYRAHAGSKTSSPLPVNPDRLQGDRSSQVCGRCHSYFFPKFETDWWEHGFSRSYSPGDDLSKAQLLLSPEVLATPGAPQLGASSESLFYRDGTIRVGGREYNGLVRSPCFERGQGDKKLSCLSCHSMHRGKADDQLDPEKLGNHACAQCHAEKAKNVSQHTHHAPSSAGSLCYNCHMPHTSYALLGAIRSHRVDSPSFDARTQDRPNACNLCHLEQSEAWAAKRAAAWYGAKPRFVLDRPPELADEQTPSGAVFALAGDAAARAVTAAALGRHESSEGAPQLRAQLLDQLAQDDYAAVRAIAARARKTVPGPSGSGPLSPTLFSDLLARRDRRPVTIAE
ncbi:MAG TPA: multiheme c-type cytochrome [Polyangiaceae bacterium]|nr:multiheme c-type cytochrome [Polyangiaceae bacterium]